MIASTIDVPMVAKAGEISNRRTSAASSLVLRCLRSRSPAWDLGDAGADLTVGRQPLPHQRPWRRCRLDGGLRSYRRHLQPIFGAFLAVTFAGELHSIFYVLGGISLVGLALT